MQVCCAGGWVAVGLSVTMGHCQKNKRQERCGSSMQEFGGFSSALAVLASAAGCGLLMGIERERRKGAGPDRALAGVRSFTLASLGGAAAALTAVPVLVVVGAVLVAALTVVAYARDRSGDPGVTTEIALFLAYLIGVTCARDQLLAAALAVVGTGLLALRDVLHQFSNQWLAHLAKRLMQARHAVALSALASGFVSSTATIGSLGMEVRAGRATARTNAGAAVLSCVATMAQIVVVAATVQPQWLARLWLPALAGGCVAAVVGWWGGRGAAHLSAKAMDAGAEVAVAVPPDTPMFKLRDALLIAALLTGIQADVHAATAAVLVRGGPHSAAAPAIAQALMAALLVHAGSKCAVALASGGWRYALAVAPGVLAHTLAFVGVLALQA